jgi:hypothetical protein
VVTPLESPRLNCYQEFGKLAADLHSANIIGALDITNCTFEPDGTLKALFSLGRGRKLDHSLTIKERARDLAYYRLNMGVLEWEVMKRGYRFTAPIDAEEVLSGVDSRNHFLEYVRVTFVKLGTHVADEVGAWWWRIKQKLPWEKHRRQQDSQRRWELKLESFRLLNIRCAEFASQLKNDGLYCPHCHEFTKHIRYLNKSPEGKSYFICQLCAWAFGPVELEEDRNGRDLYPARTQER